MAVADLQAERHGVGIDAAIGDGRHRFGVELPQLHLLAMRRQAALRDGEHLRAHVRRHDGPAFRLVVRQQPQDDVARAGGTVEQGRPALAGDTPGDAALPQAMNAEAEHVAQDVVPAGDAAEHVVVPPGEFSGVVGRGLNRNFHCDPRRLTGRHASTSASACLLRVQRERPRVFR
jgi:hypothetical protein